MQALIFDQVNMVSGGGWTRYTEAAATGALVGGLTGLRACAPLIGTGGGYALCRWKCGRGAAAGAGGAGLWTLIGEYFQS
ncbi:MAG: hypothetical protein ACJA13_000684 [Paraglaciecola sp.]|jgi:hypothetical protein